jgi:cyclase
MKIRVIPTVLTDGLTVVKGQKFNNWRTVGSAEATARLYAARDVDELILLDVTARARSGMIDLNLVRHFTNVLNVPFSVGGGISSIEDAKACLRNGAERIILGSAAVTDPQLISAIADVFGSQAIIVSIDFEEKISNQIRINSGAIRSEIDSMEFISSLEKLGAGEIMLQSIEMDGTFEGLDIDRIKQVRAVTNLPIISSGGAGSLIDFLQAAASGASAVSGGGIFQFTETTPKQVRSYLEMHGVPVRKVR